MAVLINKAMIEFPPTFAGQAPVHPEAQRQRALMNKSWHGPFGLADDVRHYGAWMREEVERRIGDLYPKAEMTAEMASVRPDLNRYVGKRLTVIAWIWARTVKSPNPAFKHVDVPLASTFLLAAKPGKEAYVRPLIKGDEIQFTVRVGKSTAAEGAIKGTKLGRGANFKCLMSDTPIADDYIRAEGLAGRMGARLMAIVAEGERERVYLAPTQEHEVAARARTPHWLPEGATPSQLTGGGAQANRYGLKTWASLFTARQLMALTTFFDLAGEARERTQLDAAAAGLPDDGKALRDAGFGASAYAEAVGVYLAFALDKSAVYWNSLCPWLNQPKNEIVGNSFGRQAMPMAWDYAEANPLSDSGGNIEKQIHFITKAIEFGATASGFGFAQQADASTQSISTDKLISH